MLMRKRIDAIRREGFISLLMSNLVILFTAGLPLLWTLQRVYARAKHTPAQAGAGTIAWVLGKRLRRHDPDADYQQRLDRALCLLHAGEVQKLVLLGGITGKEPISEAEAGRQYLLARGAPQDTLLLEDRSRHTLENLQNARAILCTEANARMILITNRYHLARSEVFADGLGLRCHLCPAETRWEWSARSASLLCVEAYYLHWYWVGKKWSQWTRNQNWLQRIN